MNFILLIIAAYLLGSIPFGQIIAKLHSIDLLKIGSGNIGATNLSRALGKKWAYFCFLLDVLKGLLPMLAADCFISSPPTTAELFLWLTVGVAAVLGHIFSIYMRFKGGKGVATSFGVALGLWPYYTIAVAVAFIVWLVCVWIWRYISLASIAASVVFPLALVALIFLKPAWSFTNVWPLLTAAVLVPIMVIARHRENIKRIRNGTESKVGEKKNSM